MCQHVQQEWFLEYGNTVAGAVRRSGFRVTGHEQDFEVGIGLAQASCQLAPADVGHDDVGEQKVDRARLFRGNAQGILTVLGEEHGVTLALEKLAHEIADAVLILDQKDGFRPRRRGLEGLLAGRNGWLRRLVGYLRKIDFERRALTRLAANPNGPVHLLDYAINCGQAKACAFARFLGRKERLEDAGLGSRVHASARITDREHDVFADGYAVAGLRVVLIHHDVPGCQGKATAQRHRVASVHGQIQDHLLDLPGVGLHAPERGRREGRQFNSVRDQPIQHFRDVVHHCVQVQYFHVQDLLAAEGQELPRQCCGTTDRSLNFQRVLVRIVRGINPMAKALVVRLDQHE